MPSEHELERRVWLDEKAELEHANEADDEYARNEKEHQDWLRRQWARVDPLDRDPASEDWSERDPADFEVTNAYRPERHA